MKERKTTLAGVIAVLLMHSSVLATTTFEVKRLNEGQPVLTRDHFLNAGATGREAENINGPSVIRVPSWIPILERPAADAKYYMYFAHHGGKYIRMAYAADPVGPWYLFNTGNAAEGSLGDLENAVPPRRTPGQGVLDLELSEGDRIETGNFFARGHVASPDVRIDEVNKRLVMYFHGPASTGRQETFVATSRYGLNFNSGANGDEAYSGLEHGVRDVIPGWSYFRTFEVAGRSFAYSNQAKLYRGPAKTAAGEPATLGNADEPGGLWKPTEDDNPAEYWELIKDDYNPIRKIYQAQERLVTDPRHFAVLHEAEVNPDRIYILYTSKGDKPERILLTELDLSGLSVEQRVEPSNWRVIGPSQRLVLEPKEDWEGADLPLSFSSGGRATGVRELRDPFIFRDDDGQIYLYYSGRGEEAIGVAGIVFGEPSITQEALPYQQGKLLFRDDFDDGLEDWSAELQSGGTVKADQGRLVIDVPGGATIWFRQLLEGPLMIEYEATVIGEGGPNDRVSDLNCFWMARDTRSPDDIFGQERSGRFPDYHQLECYYVGHGGHNNTRTRFRRYIGDQQERPLLPEHDLDDPQFMLLPNRPQRIRLVAYEGLIEYFRDDELIFRFQDAEPYTSGWFAFRTVDNHMDVRNFRVYRLLPAL